MTSYCITIKHANCYLVKIEEYYIAIDAGWAGCIHDYLKGLMVYNIKPESILYLIVTHFHPDHAGLIEEIKKFGTHFILFEHQIPYIPVMERMMSKERDYIPIDLNSNIVLNIDASQEFFMENQIPLQVIKTPGHSEDSISIVSQDGCAFVGDLYSPDLVMEEDEKSERSWFDLKRVGAKTVYPAHGNVYDIEG